jgi:hypothetical protein
MWCPLPRRWLDYDGRLKPAGGRGWLHGAAEKADAHGLHQTSNYSAARLIRRAKVAVAL